MCGIVGCIGEAGVTKMLCSGLRTLEYRGYDSCGMSLIEAGKIDIIKDVGSIGEVDERCNFNQLTGMAGIAHTRWATHGAVTMPNAHPHLSNDKTFSIAHNGIINNYEQLKAELTAKKYSFSSDTDSEVIANLLQYFYQKTGRVTKAIEKTVAKLEGCYSLAILSTHEPKLIFGVKFFLPLVVGISAKKMFLSSDVMGFLVHTNKVVILEDNEYVVISSQGHDIFSFTGKKLAKRLPILISDTQKTATKGKFAHYMLKEIFDQPQIILHALAIKEEKLQKIVNYCYHAKNPYLVGIGTTFYIALAGSYLFQEYGKLLATALPSDEFCFNINFDKEKHALFISQSGETYDTKEALSCAKKSGMSTSAIGNSPQSTIARSVDCFLDQNSGQEISVVSTKAALAQLVIMGRIAVRIGIKNNIQTSSDAEKYDQDLTDFSKKLAGMLPGLTKQLSAIATKWAGYRHILCMGKGIYHPVALEAALKIKEVAYIHAEGMPTGFLKHGTLALIDKNVPCLFFMPPSASKHLYESTLTAIEEVKARGGVVMAFCEDDNELLKKKLDYTLPLPKMPGQLYPFYQIIIMQIFAYYLANKLGNPIDKPRNLAKSVTVP
ncbi:MAG: glutamine--fructose-6-phosphate transaminase (isomerizing) [SAR324 cluster bacterium]|nr:glutamine--fructose-6-phosphate transaminase (isomerizing) [SAR324 cluster bacterium]